MGRTRMERRGLDFKSCAARPLLGLCLAAVLTMGAGAARAAEIGAQLGLDRSGIDGDSPPNSQYTDKFGLVAGIQGEIALAHDLSLSLQPSFVQKHSGLLIAPASRGGSTTERISSPRTSWLSSPIGRPRTRRRSVISRR